MNQVLVYSVGLQPLYTRLRYTVSTVLLCQSLLSQAQVTPPCAPGCVQLTVQRFAGKVTTTPAPIIDKPFQYEVPATESAWGSYNTTVLSGQPIGEVSVQESSTLRLEVRKGYGGSIQIYDKVTKQNLINFYDKGREAGMSTYAGPDSFSDDAPYWRTGYNPLQAGDAGGNPARVLFHGFINGYIYTRYQSNSWSHVDNRLLPFFYEQWVKLDGNKVLIKIRMTHHRPDKTFYPPRGQEWPFMFINGTKYVRFYNGPAPFTFAPTNVSSGIERQPTPDTYVPHQLTPFQITEPWMGTEIGVNPTGETRLIALTGPEFYKVASIIASVQSQGNSEGDITATYWSHSPVAHVDPDNIWLKEFTYVVDNESTIRNYVYAQARSTKPDFVFSKANGRNGWYIQDGGHDQQEPFQVDNWTVTFDGKADAGQPLSARGTKLVSPMGVWKASDFNTLYIKMRYSGPESQLRIGFLLDGQAPDGMDSNYPNQNSIRYPRGTRDQNKQSVRFKVNNDGQMHTYKIKMSDNDQWKSIIQQLELGHELEGAIINPGEVLELAYFGANEP